MSRGSTALRVLIVDDEAPARLAVRQHLDEIGEIEVLAECANGFEAIKALAQQRPDVMLLDVQMPKLDGFDVLEVVGREVPVVFITAHDEFALRAFEVHAVDYLLKPFTTDRLREALTRVRNRQVTVNPQQLRMSARKPGSVLDRVIIRDGADVHVVVVGKIDYAEAQDDYVAFHTGGRSLLKEQTLTDLESQLDGRRFVRIHRSYLLNIDRLAKVELYAKDSRVAILHDGTKLPVSRTGYQRLQQLL